MQRGISCAVCATHTQPRAVPWSQHAIGCPVRAELVRPSSTLVIGNLFDRDGMASVDRQEARDAVNECPHGRLPHDQRQCACWKVAA